MAATRLISIRGSKAQSVIKSLTERTDYVNNPEKTENGALVYIELNAEPDMENNAPSEPVAEEREDKRPSLLAKLKEPIPLYDPKLHNQVKEACR